MLDLNTPDHDAVDRSVPLHMGTHVLLLLLQKLMVWDQEGTESSPSSFGVALHISCL